MSNKRTIANAPLAPDGSVCAWCGYQGDDSDPWWIIRTDRSQEERVCDFCQMKLHYPTIASREQVRAMRALDDHIEERGRQMAEAIEEGTTEDADTRWARRAAIPPYEDGEAKFSTPSKLTDLEEVINTRTPVWDIAGSGDVRVKLDTDVNGQEWYVLSDNSSRGKPFDGIAYCWAFPHWNGDFYFYRYVPVAFCYKTFAELLLAHPTERAMWAYDVEEYAQRVIPN